MPALAQLRNPRRYIEPAIVGVLTSACAGLVSGVYGTMDAAVKTTGDDQLPWVEVDFDPGEGTGHLFPCSDSVCRPDSWRGTLAVRVVSCRQQDGETALHGRAAGAVCAALDAGQTLFNSSNLPWHQIVDVRQKGSPFQATNEDDLDTTEIQYSTVACIRASAWPMAIPARYRRPDGESAYLRPGGATFYLRP